MNHFKLLAAGLPVQPLIDAINANPQLWDANTIRQDFPGSPHHDTQCIWLRAPERIAPDTVFDDLVAHDTGAMDVLQPAANEILKPIMEALGVKELGRMMVVTLRPGGVIDPHPDQGAYAEHYERFHLVLTSDYGNRFYCGDDMVHMQPGELWTFDHRTEHTVVNDSTLERIHVIFDAVRVTQSDEPKIGANSTEQLHGIVEGRYADFIANAGQLLQEHWEEVAKNKGIMVLKPDNRRYIAMEQHGILFTLVAYDHGKLVGYSLNFINQHLHYADLRYAQNDVLFVKDEYRNSPWGLKLIKETERVAREKGARMMLWHAKQGTQLDKIMPRLKYGVQDIIYSKEL